ncbi:MAG: type I DNA topoisomerase [Clostridia bacterium]|nr:type I DNA topoisomerase [Clostridia bacterium]
MSYLVIVESPAKATTIKSYLGSNYRVIASKGHIRDLPKSTLGIDVENGFTPHYINIRGKGDVIKELRREAKNATRVFLATDPDREGEAISWHIASQLGIPEGAACRITFNEITKAAVKDAIKNPRPINIDLVNSQQARRILDRLVGFNLSELLWKSVKSGLSGGRVQSVAARIIAEREEEIRAFVPHEYWTVEASLLDNEDIPITVKLVSDNEGRLHIDNSEEAERIISKLKTGCFRVSSVKHFEKHRMPAPPFTTSTLQQEASKRLGFQSQKTMKIAQELYDGLNLGSEFGGVQGLITYMRTDSLRIASTAQDAARDYIKENFGEDCLPDAPRNYRSNSNSQDAHEAIRPSNVSISPKSIRKLLSTDQYRLYRLIWERFLASQMQYAVLDTVTVEVENSGYLFKTGGYIIKSRGFLNLYQDDMLDEEGRDSDGLNMSSLPNVIEGQTLALESVEGAQHFTEPPARYTEASLIKFLEENGIGRPSTYAPIISIITSRQYVKRDGKMLVATPLGEITTNFMKEHFPRIIDYEFTANMESELDSIENGERTIEGVISGFYTEFAAELEAANRASEGKERVNLPQDESDVLCDKCGARMVYKEGRFGKFLACPNFPTCKNTKAIDKAGNIQSSEPVQYELAGFKCDECGGEMVIRNGRYGTFYACINYPTCRFTKQKIVSLDVPCPLCSSKILARHGKGKMVFYSCESYPDCDFSSWDMPLSEKCPDCGGMLFYRKTRKSVVCKNGSCGYKRDEEMTVIE